MNEEKKPDLKTLGLPPIELAENTTYIRRENSPGIAQKCFHPWLKRVIGTVIITAVAIVTYIVLFRILQSGDTRSTEIIVVTGLRDTSNVTIEQQNVDIFVQIKNKTSNRVRRKKRDLNSKEIADTFKLHDETIKKARKIIMEHDEPCDNTQTNTFCKNLVTKLDSVSKKRSTVNDHQDHPELTLHLRGVDNEELNKNDNINRSEHDKLQAFLENKSASGETSSEYHSPLEVQPIPPQPYPVIPSPISDSCLLARLLKQNPQQLHGVYDIPASYLPPPPQVPYQQIPAPYPSYIPSPYIESRLSSDTQKQWPHPQDIEIMRFHPSERTAATSKESHMSTREAECPDGSISCDDNESCIAQKQWCDGLVDCADASDESRCPCKTRIDKSRLCDGYYDCPFGEDEMGCFGCSEATFSCEDLDLNSRSTCFTGEQRCDNVVDCPNHKDEIECNLLAPNLHEKPMFAVSNTEGFLQRNFRGTWFPVCNNPYMWAHDACRRETGLIIRPPYIQMLPIDPSLKFNYVNTGPGGAIQMSDSCGNSSAIYVTCPDLLCGTRVLTTPQFLRESASFENHLFGRNKRYLSRHPVYFNRMKRYTNYYINELTETIERSKRDVDWRNKRTETRVVGGRPSQPAAWPWIVAMYKNGMFHCGGVVISQRWIVSAAHCVHKFWENFFEIRVGMLRRFSYSPQESNHLVTHVIVNHKYDRSDMKNDLSLLRVKPAIQFSRWVRPICLPGPDTAGPDWMWGPPPGTMCVAVGWGSTVEHGPDPDHLREVELPIWAQCKHSEDRAGKEICAGPLEGGKDACQGDSGGPLLCRNPLNAQQWYMAGIVSHGDGCARKGEPGVYTRVSIFGRWIKHHIFSKGLPTIQPKQECPGFKCVSGISKCLPKRRMCDKIVDCLDGEDEMNCNFQKAAHESEPNLFLRETSSNTDSRRNHFETREADPEVNVTEGSIIKQNTNNETTMNSLKIEKPKAQSNIMDLRDRKRINEMEKLKPIFTLKNTTSSENSGSDSDENSTTDPFDDSKENSRGDIQTLSVTGSRKELESRSMLSNNKIHFLRETEITEDLEDAHTTTTESEDEIAKTTNSHDFSTNNTSTTTELSFTNKLEDTTITTTVNKSDNETKKNEKESKNFSIELPFDDNDRLNSNDNKSLNKHILEPGLSQSINKIQDLVSSQLIPAKLRKRHPIPKMFDCRRINQNIPYKSRCDHKADCEDGTDEFGCSCIDYLSTFDEKLICDGIVDCADGQDESNCSACPDDQFLCTKSSLCLPIKNVCDGKPECPHEEDELNCLTLSNGKYIEVDIDGQPRVSSQGYVTRKHGNKWNILCEDNFNPENLDEAATHICRYLGYSSANRYLIKYINVKSEANSKSNSSFPRKRRESSSVPINFEYRKVDIGAEKARNIVIRDPQLIKEQCVPNITKTCMSLFVSCEHNLFTNLERFFEINDLSSREVEANVESQTWPWIAKVFIDGNYRCTGILVDQSWVLVSHTCLWDSLLIQNYISVVLGSQRTLRATHGPYEQIYQVNGKKELYQTKVSLLHLKDRSHSSRMVKPMVVPAFKVYSEEKDEICLTVGQDDNNNTVSVFLKESEDNCDFQSRCFVRYRSRPLCSKGMVSPQPWAGIVTCHGPDGWYPAAAFVEAKGECGMGDKINGSDLGNLKMAMKHYMGKPLTDSNEQIVTDACDGARCERGRCVKFSQLCDGIRDCEDGKDELQDACDKKNNICKSDPHHRGCDCSSGQLKCKNGRCISKELFGDGNNDCGDLSDEPGHASCAQYLARVKPVRLCDGVLHCDDKTDEDPMFCKCFSIKSYKCGASDHCVSPDLVCDGTTDCPNNEDELTCLALRAPSGTPYGTGEVIVRSHGVWHSKCYPKANHTRTELEKICRNLGFISGHAKQLQVPKNSDSHILTRVELDPFNEVFLNNNTSIKLRNNDRPLARAVFDIKPDNCHPVYIECL